MPLVVGVAFKPVTKVYFFDPAGHGDLRLGERVVVDTARGRTLGIVMQPTREVPADEISGALKPVIRRANALDVVQQDQQAHREPEVLRLCRERTEALGLPMKVVNVEFNFEGSSLLVYFTAEQRIDFRNLVHDLAQTLHAHVEMRQIGVRDEAKFLGGYGRCGRQLCCAAWLREFTPVSIKQAKQQDLPLNPAEISGCCGRLLCCLSYENDFYAEARRGMPKVNSTVMTTEGPGKVRQVHVLRNSVTVQVQGPNETKMLIEVPLGDAGKTVDGGCAGCPRAAEGDEIAGGFAADEDQAEDFEPDAADLEGVLGNEGNGVPDTETDEAPPPGRAKMAPRHTRRGRARNQVPPADRRSR